ncbi:MAG: glycosyltransferase family 4 protein [Spirochaetota bacterium]
MKKRLVLLVSQNFAATGSEIALYRLLQGSTHSQIRFDAFLTASLKPELPIHGQLAYVYGVRAIDIIRHRMGAILRRIMGMKPRAMNGRSIRFESILRKNQYDLVYFNTIVFPDLITICAQLKIKYCVHVHELEHMYGIYPQRSVAELSQLPAHLIFTSRAAEQAMKVLGPLPSSSIISPGISIPDTKSPTVKRRPAALARPFLWFGAGTDDVNKNIRLFIDTAGFLHKAGVNCHFVWLGIGMDNLRTAWLENYANTLGLQGRLRLLPRITNPAEYTEHLSLADAVMITSFRESFSLVALEALALGKPILTFKNGGHMEYMTRTNGVVVENYDYQAFFRAAKSMVLRRNTFVPERIKKTAQQFELSRQAKLWRETLHGILNEL